MEKFIDVFDEGNLTDEEKMVKNLVDKFSRFKVGDEVYWVDSENSVENLKCICDKGKILIEGYEVRCPVCRDVIGKYTFRKPVIRNGVIKSARFEGGFLNGISHEFKDSGECIKRNGSWYFKFMYDVSNSKEDYCTIVGFSEGDTNFCKSREECEWNYHDKYDTYRSNVEGMKKCIDVGCKLFDECDYLNYDDCDCSSCELFGTCDGNCIL